MQPLCRLLLPSCLPLLHSSAVESLLVLAFASKIYNKKSNNRFNLQLVQMNNLRTLAADFGGGAFFFALFLIGVFFRLLLGP